MLAVKEKRDLTSGWGLVDTRAKQPQGWGGGKSTVRINPIDHSSNFNSKSPKLGHTSWKFLIFHCYVRLMVFIYFGSIWISFSLPKTLGFQKQQIATFLTSGSSPNTTAALRGELLVGVRNQNLHWLPRSAVSVAKKGCPHEIVFNGLQFLLIGHHEDMAKHMSNVFGTMISNKSIYIHSWHEEKKR